MDQRIRQSILILKDMSPEEQIDGGEVKKMWDEWNEDNKALIEPDYLNSDSYKREVAELYRKSLKERSKLD